MIRVCPKRDAECPHGSDCPYAIDRYECADDEKPFLCAMTIEELVASEKLAEHFPIPDILEALRSDDELGPIYRKQLATALEIHVRRISAQARTQALEESAKIAEAWPSFIQQQDVMQEEFKVNMAAALTIARRIRALLTKESAT